MAKYCFKYTYMPPIHSLYDLHIHSLADFTIPILWEKKKRRTSTEVHLRDRKIGYRSVGKHG